MSICRVISYVARIGCLIWPVCSLGKTLLAFAWLHFVLQGQTCLLLQVSLDFLLHTVLYDEKDIFFFFFFFAVSSRRSCRSWENHSTSASVALVVEAETWITVVFNGLPWKWTEIILLFLILHPSTTFQTLLLTLRTTLFLLRDSCLQ